MKNYFSKILAALILFSAFSSISPSWSLEIITREDITQGIIIKTDLIKTADNALILFDSSRSMKKPYKDSGMSKYDVAVQTLMERNEYFPDLGHNFGLYLYTPWEAVYSVQKYERDNFAKALETLQKKESNPTRLKEGLTKLDPILKTLEGKTAVFIFTDGSPSSDAILGKTPVDIALDLAQKYDVCFYLINTSDKMKNSDLNKKLQNYDFCSRVIAFEDFIEYPEYNSEALFTVKATRDIITITEKRVVGIKPNDILFDFDKSDLSPDAKERLDLLALFLNDNKNTYALLAGYADGTGSEEVNMKLSLERVAKIKNYLLETHQVDRSQLIPFWYGDLNPVADNSTREGRRLNRRVEILVGGMDD